MEKLKVYERLPSETMAMLSVGFILIVLVTVAVIVNISTKNLGDYVYCEGAGEGVIVYNRKHNVVVISGKRLDINDSGDSYYQSGKFASYRGLCYAETNEDIAKLFYCEATDYDWKGCQ